MKCNNCGNDNKFLETQNIIEYNRVYYAGKEYPEDSKNLNVELVEIIERVCGECESEDVVG